MTFSHDAQIIRIWALYFACLFKNLKNWKLEYWIYVFCISKKNVLFVTRGNFFLDLFPWEYLLIV